MPAPRKYPDELRESATRMALEARRSPEDRPDPLTRIRQYRHRRRNHHPVHRERKQRRAPFGLAVAQRQVVHVEVRDHRGDQRQQQHRGHGDPAAPTGSTHRRSLPGTLTPDARPEVALPADLGVRLEEFDVWSLDYGLEVRMLPCWVHQKPRFNALPVACQGGG